MTRFLSHLLPAVVVTLLGLVLPTIAAPEPAAAPAKKPKPKVEVVFCLDTTGSMGGLIEGAKAKIWSICNHIAGGKPTPDLRVGLVAYRDKGDTYVTKVVEMTDDLDAIHAKLKTFDANGGGDTPEHVNQALDDSVNKIKWSDDKKTLKIIFLVGDAPPQMGYADDVKYPDTCKKAVEKGIIINTIQCGVDEDATKAWKDIATKAEGSYAAIPQDGGVRAVKTPFDADLAKLNSDLASTTVAYGETKVREKVEKVAEAAAALPPGAAADRAGFSGKSAKGAAAGDLIDALKDKKVKLSDIKKDELPKEMQELKTDKERQEYLDKVSTKRTELQKKAAELDKKRQEYIEKEQKKEGKPQDGFDTNVLEMLRKQAKKVEIAY
jgi:Mg-chelatase subunit ChlD